MKDRIVELLGLIVLTFLLGGLCYFADVVYTDHYNRTHPMISAPLPKTVEEMQTPPTYLFDCGTVRVSAASDTYIKNCTQVEPKG